MSNQSVARGNRERREAIVDAWLDGLPQRLTRAALKEKALELYLHGELNFRLRQAERARKEQQR